MDLQVGECLSGGTEFTIIVTSTWFNAVPSAPLTLSIGLLHPTHLAAKIKAKIMWISSLGGVWISVRLARTPCASYVLERFTLLGGQWSEASSLGE